MNDVVKPRVSAENQRAYARIEALPAGTQVVFEGRLATFAGMTGFLITLNTGRNTVYLRAWDKRLPNIEVPNG